MLCNDQWIFKYISPIKERQFVHIILRFIGKFLK